MSTQAAIAIIDDDRAIRKSLTRLLASAGLEVRAFVSARDFLETPGCGGFSCLVSDLRMPGVDGLQLQETLRSKLPQLSIIFITGYGDVPSSVTAMKAGATDFLEKPVKAQALLQAIDRAVQRSRELSTAMAEIQGLKARYDRLTPRERQVFSLVAAGLLNKQAGAELGAAEKTIKQHRGQVMAKMQAESLADLVLMAERLGVLPKRTDWSKARGRTPAS